ncbi:MAG: S41 family peptidase [Coriobacteriia bacterium]|nr:S41 family peptidase [Coriobacteriia bacterium]
MNRTLLYVISGFIALLMLATVFSVGLLVGRATDFGSIPTPSPRSSTLTDHVREVERLLDREALVPSEDASKTAGAIRGLLEGSGDRYAAYFDPEHYEYFSEQSDGQFFGIGVNIGERDGGVYVVSVMEGTPAEAAGLKADDIFTVIDEVRRDTWTSEEVVKRVRGPEGSTVELTIFRPAEEAELDFAIKRARIDIPNIMAEREGDVGYLRLLSFNQRSAPELAEEIDAMEAEGVKGFVIDVRDNPGGLLQSSVDVASLFIADGVIVTVEDRSGETEVHRANGKTATDAPIVILMNGNSASASEVLAGALQDYGRAKLVGEQSFGKGSVQGVRELSFGGAVKFTTAHYLTPLGRAINGTGLTPDVIVEMDLELQAEKETDVQRARAIRLIEREL